MFLVVGKKLLGAKRPLGEIRLPRYLASAPGAAEYGRAVPLRSGHTPTTYIASRTSFGLHKPLHLTLQTAPHSLHYKPHLTHHTTNQTSLTTQAKNHSPHYKLNLTHYKLHLTHHATNQTSLTTPHSLQTTPHHTTNLTHHTTNQISLSTLQTNPHSPHHNSLMHQHHHTSFRHSQTCSGITNHTSFRHHKLHHTLTSQITFHSNITNHISLRHHEPHPNPINNAFAGQVCEEWVLRPDTVVQILPKNFFVTFFLSCTYVLFDTY